MDQRVDLNMEARRLTGGLDGQDDVLLDDVMAWSSQNSGSHNSAGLRIMRQILADAFSVLPGRISEIALPPMNCVERSGDIVERVFEPALEVCVRPDAEIQLVLTGHYDTVFPADFHFQTPVRVDDDVVNGPGTADMKGGLRVMLAALSAFEDASDASKVGYTVLMSPDEEIGSPGSKHRLAELGRTAHVGMTYEPALADGSLAGARKGSGNFDLVVRGRAAHAGRDHGSGRNAIAAVAGFVMGLERLNGQRKGVTFNIAKVDGGGAVNIVPELGIARFNVRVRVPGDCPWVLRQLDTLLADINNADGLSAHLHGGFTRPPKPMSKSNATVFNWVKRAGADLGQDIRWSPSGGVCEGNNLYASGCANVDTLGVRGGSLHSDQEFMHVSSLVERAKLSSLILQRISTGQYDAKALKTLAMSELD